MATSIHAPRLNNNDDVIRLTQIVVRIGDHVTPGQVLCEIETDKATVSVDSDRPGYVLKILHEVDAQVPVGSMLFWLGDTPHEAVPDTSKPAGERSNHRLAEPTAKARSLIAQHGLNVADIPARGDRLSVADVEAYLRHHVEKQTVPVETPALVEGRAVGELRPLSSEERGMLRSVQWHRDEAVPAYLEMEFDQTPWERHAKTYAAERRLLGDPLLPLLAQRLVGIAAKHPRLNSTIVGQQRYAYSHVNLGFTIQVQDCLYLAVVSEAEAKAGHAFIEALNKLHKKAIARKLEPADLQGATVAFSSMARWQVARHIPVLPPHVSMIVAHTVSRENRAILGATYDHRVLSGGDAIGILQELSRPPG